MKKTAAKSKSKSHASHKHHPIVHGYLKQRDQFFVDHPNSQVLLGILIVLLALFIGVTVWGQMKLKDYQFSEALSGNDVYATY